MTEQVVFSGNASVHRILDRGDLAREMNSACSCPEPAAYIDADRQMARLVFGHEIGHILLPHLGAFSDNILPDLLELLGKKGLSLVTLEEAQRDPVYQLDPDAASPSRNLLEQWMDVRAIKYPPVTTKPYKELEAICSSIGFPERADS